MSAKGLPTVVTGRHGFYGGMMGDRRALDGFERS